MRGRSWARDAGTSMGTRGASLRRERAGRAGLVREEASSLGGRVAGLELGPASCDAMG
jgi:hypothetical protein